MSIPPEVVSKIIGYTTSYPQKYKTISKSVASYITDTPKSMIDKKYPNIFIMPKEIAIFQLNKMALENEWEDFIIVINMYIDKYKDNKLDKISFIKWAVSIAHRFGQEQIANKLVSKYNPKIDSKGMRKYNVSSNRYDSRYDDFSTNVLEIILFTIKNRLNKGQYTNELEFVLPQIKGMINSNKSLFIGNVDRDSYIRLRDDSTLPPDHIVLSDLQGVSHIIPMGGKYSYLDFYSYLLITNPNYKSYKDIHVILAEPIVTQYTYNTIKSYMSEVAKYNGLQLTINPVYRYFFYDKFIHKDDLMNDYIEFLIDKNRLKISI